MTLSVGATSNTGSISSAGIGSGLDVNSIISSLMSVESQPLTLLQNQAQTITTEISAVGQIKSLASSLQDKANALADSSLWTQTTSSTADPTVVTADTSSGNAPPGDYSVSVQQMATGQTVTSAPMATTTPLTSGSLSIQLGTWAAGPPPTFANQANSNAVSIPIEGDTSLSAIRDKINAANAGVTASIITDANGSRLSLRSTATGAENGFKVTATEDSPNNNPSATTSLTTLNYDPTSANSSLTLNQTAVNALATVNGISVESASNKLSNISDGLSLTLLKVSAAPIDVTVSTDTASMQTAITNFVTAYSALNANIHDATKYDSSTAVSPGTSRTDGPLEGDPSIISFQNQLRGILNTTSTTSTMYSRLSDIGISIQADGSLATNTTKLTAAMQHPDELAKLFSTQGTTNANTGVAVRFANLVDTSLLPDGSLASRTSGLQGELSRNGQQQTDMQTHLDATQARLTAQYQALDTSMASMSALGSYVSQQVSMMEK